jgi:hypothetical protein
LISFGYDTSTQGDHEQGHRPKRHPCTFSFIRTVTVGSGISPDLLTLFLLAPQLGPKTGTHFLGCESGQRKKPLAGSQIEV